MVSKLGEEWLMQEILNVLSVVKGSRGSRRLRSLFLASRFSRIYACQLSGIAFYTEIDSYTPL